jgi:hypothetical protein
VKKWLTIILIAFSLNAYSQLFETKGFGGTAGVVMNFGTHVNRFGLNVNTYYYHKFFQINAGSQFRFNIISWEGFKRGFEMVPYVGAQIYFSKGETDKQFIVHQASLNSGKKYGFGYTYKLYWSSIGTSQTSGVIGIHIKDLSFIIENDILGFNHKDRFRTSAVGIYFRFLDYEVGIQNILWTGETKGVAVKVDSTYKARLGFKDISSLPYGKTSHGIVAAKLSYRLPYGQIVNASIGWDSEAVRHVFQNKIVHDLLKDPHYPKLDKDGNPILHKDKEKRKSKFFFQIGSNNSGFY